MGMYIMGITLIKMLCSLTSQPQRTTQKQNETNKQKMRLERCLHLSFPYPCLATDYNTPIKCEAGTEAYPLTAHPN